MIIQSDKINQISEYFFSRKMKEIDHLNQMGIKIINLGIGNPDLSPPNGVIDKMKKASDLKFSNAYQNYIGLEKFRQSISKWYKKIYNVSIHPDNEILPLIGSKEGIMYISMCYLNPGDQVLIPNPGYPTYSSVSKLLGAKIIYYNLYEKEDWQPDIRLLESMNLSKIKIIWLNSPHMPTGSKIYKSKLEKIISLAINNSILIVYDNPYSCITDQKKFFSIFNIKNAKSIALELNSLSKNYNMPGWRIGMVIGNKKLIKNILKVSSQSSSGMYYPIQIGAIEAMKNDWNWFHHLNQEYSKRRKLVWKICDLLNLKYSKNHNSGIFVWAKLTDYQDDIIWSEKIMKQYQIFITPGRVFGTNGKGYLRFSICCPFKILEEVKKRISK